MEVYPQQAAQQEGLGFPVARMVVLMSLATAMLGGMAIGPYSGKETGELALLRRQELKTRPDPSATLSASAYGLEIVEINDGGTHVVSDSAETDIFRVQTKVK